MFLHAVAPHLDQGPMSKRIFINITSKHGLLTVGGTTYGPALLFGGGHNEIPSHL